VDQARTEQATFDVALKQRASEKKLWTTLSIVAGFALLAWIGGTAAYIVHMEADGMDAAHASPKKPPPSAPPPQARETPPRGNPAPPTPPPRPGGTKRPK
jgi:hypothetical protein